MQGNRKMHNMSMIILWFGAALFHSSAGQQRCSISQAAITGKLNDELRVLIERGVNSKFTIGNYLLFIRERKKNVVKRKVRIRFT